MRAERAFSMHVGALARIDVDTFMRIFVPGSALPEDVDVYAPGHELLGAEDVVCGEMVCTLTQAVRLRTDFSLSVAEGREFGSQLRITLHR